jgi:hypothetical protein
MEIKGSNSPTISSAKLSLISRMQAVYLCHLSDFQLFYF